VSTFVKASYVPLFDRLCALDSGFGQARLLETPGIQASIQRDLLRLITTRNGLTIAQHLAGAGSVLDYGVPDLLTLCVQSDTDLQQAAAVVGHAIATFEPRLTDVIVQAQRDPRNPERARFTLSASAVMGQRLQRVDFEISLSDQGGLVTPYP
jgi:type VI secretion system lysozyme-like protein